jgi:hypothetical protein
MSPLFSLRIPMFIVVAHRTDSKTEAQPVAERAAALATAARWSLTADHDVQVFRGGEANALCTYRTGARVFCRCPETTDDDA